jgi:hypothetical protein
VQGRPLILAAFIENWDCIVKEFKKERSIHILQQKISTTVANGEGNF